MVRYNSMSLIGNNSININSLAGYDDEPDVECIEYINNIETSMDNTVKFVNYTKKNPVLGNLQKKIYNKLLLPLLKYDFKTVTNNYHLYQYYNKELMKCQVNSREEKEEKNFYKELLKFIDLSKNSNEKLEKFNLKDFGGTMGFMINLSAVTLKAEYIIYDNILGKPEKFNYDKKIISKIKRLIKENPEADYNDLFNNVKQEYYKNI